MRTLDVPSAEGEESNARFIDSVGLELERILAEHHAGRLILRSDHRQALEETRRSLEQLRPTAAPANQARIDQLLEQVDFILGSQDDASAAIAMFLAPLRETRPAGAVPPAPRPRVDRVPPPAWPAPPTEPYGATDDYEEAEPYAGAEPYAPADQHQEAEPYAGAEPYLPADPYVPAASTELPYVPAPPLHRPTAVPLPDQSGFRPAPAPAPTTATPLAEATPGPRPHRRWLTPLGAAAAVLLLATAALGWLSLHNYDATSKWRALDAQQAAMTGRVTAQLQTANRNIATLNGQVKSLDSQVTSAQGRLSTVANQKEVAIDQQTVLKQFAGVAATVAAALQECVIYSSRLQTDLNSAIASKNPAAITAIQPESAQVAALCSRAETANQALQTAIQSGA